MRDLDYVKTLKIGVKHIANNFAIPALDDAAIRMRRQILLAGLQKLIYPFFIDKIDKESGEIKRKSEFSVHMCGRFCVDDTSVKIYKNAESLGWSGLMRCGSVHFCPVCAAKVFRLRGEQISQIFDHVHNKNGSALLITFTFGHKGSDKLSDLMLRFREAKKFMVKHRRFRNIREAHGNWGFASTTEITYSLDHGWHPHYHDAWFMNNNSLIKVDCDALASELFKIWKIACEKFGLNTIEFYKDRRIGVDVRESWNAADYMTKFDRERSWSLPAEMTAGRLKMAKSGSFTPWSLLESAIIRGRDSTEFKLFLEYMRACKNFEPVSLRGCRNLCLELGLPTSLNDFKDANLQGEAEIIGEIDATKFDLVVRQGGMGRILEAVRNGENIDIVIAKEFSKQTLKQEF